MPCHSRQPANWRNSCRNSSVRTADPQPGMTMKEKILVTYATRAGSTAGVAEAIGSRLAEAGGEVEVLPMQEVKDLSTYRAVVLGSAIQDRQWLPEAMDFVRQRKDELARLPVAAFLV